MRIGDFGHGGGGPGGVGAVLHQGEMGEDIFKTFDGHTLQRFFAFVRPHLLALAGSLAAVVVFVGSQVSIPIVIRYAVDIAVGKKSSPSLEIVVAAFVLLVATNALGSFLQEWSASRLAQRVIFDLRRAMFAHLQEVSLSFLDQTHVGRVMSRLQGDVNSLQEFLETSVSAIGDLALLIGIIVVLLAMDLKLALLTLTVLPVLIGARAIWLPRVKATFRRARDASSIVNGALAENIGGVRTVQEARRETINFSDFDDKASDNFTAQIKAAKVSQIMVPTVDILTGIAQAVIVVVGGSAVLNGRLDVGVMIAFIFYVQRFFDPIRTLSQQYTVMQRAMAAGHRIFEVLDVPVSIKDKPDAVALVADRPSIEFRHVAFGYKPGQPVLHDFNLSIAPQRVVALVGPTGSGKTSVTALLHRFYDVWEGTILVGGHDVRDVTRDSLGRAIAMVLQEPFLFSGTVLENIRFSSSGASREDIVAAAKAVRAHDFIMGLADGYDTELGQRGQNLSVGQRQLLSLARALVADPAILVLDEATASIDSFTELDIQEALKVLLRGRTCVVIAHRLATVRHADHIIVLHHGAILEQGTHDDLVTAGGLYAELYLKSYSSFDDLAAEAI
jgi:ATP-binding cassette subfamily B protein